MANSDAWQAGIDIVKGRKAKKKGDATDDTASVKTPSGGLLGAASKGLQKLRNRSKQAPAGAANNEALGLTTPTATFQSYKHGGRVRKTGLAYLHKNEVVIPAKGKSRHKVSRKRTTIKA